MSAKRTGLKPGVVGGPAKCRNLSNLVQRTECESAENPRGSLSVELVEESTEELESFIKQTYNTLVMDRNAQINEIFQAHKKQFKETEPIEILTVETPAKGTIKLKPVAALPPMKSFIPISRNIRAKDEEVLKFAPYLGDSFKAEKFYKDCLLVAYQEPGHNQKEIEDHFLVPLAAEVLKNPTLTNDLEIVLSGIKDSLKLDISARELRQQYKKATQTEKPSEVQKPIMCRTCFLIGCKDHEAPLPKVKTWNKSEQVPLKLGNCGEKCHKRVNGTSSGDDNDWSNDDRKFFQTLRSIYNDNYCELAKAMQTKSCSEVAKFAENTTEEDSLSTNNAVEASSFKQSKRKRDNAAPKVFAKSVDKQFPQPKYYKPCNHPQKECGEGCQCFDTNNTCEKFCNCDINTCKNRIGCNCEAQCITKQCSCFFAMRECDPELCHKITGREDPPKHSCKNLSMFLGKTTKLVMGTSDISGWGLFALQDIEKNDFIIEYCGELVSSAEADRRGMIYDEVGTNYLFLLTEDMEIDATRKGNLARFINHHVTKDNCEPRRLKVNGEYRMGIFAKEKILKGSELLFNYGDSFHPLKKTAKKAKPKTRKSSTTKVKPFVKKEENKEENCINFV